MSRDTTGYLDCECRPLGRFDLPLLDADNFDARVEATTKAYVVLERGLQLMLNPADIPGIHLDVCTSCSWSMAIVPREVWTRSAATAKTVSARMRRHLASKYPSVTWYGHAVPDGEFHPGGGGYLITSSAGTQRNRPVLSLWFRFERASYTLSSRTYAPADMDAVCALLDEHGEVGCKVLVNLSTVEGEVTLSELAAAARDALS